MNRPIKNKDGILVTKTEQQLERWNEHFQEVLNCTPPIELLEKGEGPDKDINRKYPKERSQQGYQEAKK